MSYGIPRVSHISTSQVASLFETPSSPIPNGGLFTREECRNLAKSIIEAYDGNKDDACDTIEVGKWLVDCYRAMNREYQPTATDIASYRQIIDRKQQGKIGLAELQEFIVRYFLHKDKP